MDLHELLSRWWRRLSGWRLCFWLCDRDGWRWLWLFRVKRRLEHGRGDGASPMVSVGRALGRQGRVGRGHALDARGAPGLGQRRTHLVRVAQVVGTREGPRNLGRVGAVDRVVADIARRRRGGGGGWLASRILLVSMHFRWLEACGKNTQNYYDVVLTIIKISEHTARPCACGAWVCVLL